MSHWDFDSNLDDKIEDRKNKKDEEVLEDADDTAEEDSDIDDLESKWEE